MSGSETLLVFAVSLVGMISGVVKIGETISRLVGICRKKSRVE